MPKRHHGVRLAAAEVGLQFDDWISTLAGKPDQCAGQQPLQSFGDECAAIEFRWVLVLFRTFVLIDLPQIGGKLGLLVGAFHHVAMRSDHFTPRFQSALRLALGGDERRLPHFAASLLVELQSQQIHPHLANLFGFGCRDCGKQPLHAVKRPVGIAARKGFLVCPLVANVAQFADQAPFRRSQRLGEYDIPLVPQHGQKALGIKVELFGLASLAAFRRLPLPCKIFPLIAVDALEFPLDKRPQALVQQVEGLANSFSVSDCHVSTFCQSLIKSEQRNTI